MRRYSSRREKLDQQFLVEKLKGAVSYDRIAGYFSSSILEIAGESIESVEGKVRVICNSHIMPEDVEVANHAQKLKQEWCEIEPELLYSSEASQKRLALLHRLLTIGKLEIKVIPDQIFGLMHGKAGVIRYKDGTKTSFVGSVNETQSAFRLNYEIVWEDDSSEAVQWVEDEFNYFWDSQYAVPLGELVVKDIARISNRKIIDLDTWKKDSEEVVPSVAVEEPVYRREFGLWEHQKYFVELAFDEHKKEGGARFLLADQVGLGKTLQLALAAKLMALYGDKPILIVVPKTLVWQWQNELKTLLNMPSAVWIGRGWQDEHDNLYQADEIRSILKCPRKVGIVSQGLISRRTEAFDLLIQKEYECVIVDEAHRARRKNPTKDPEKHKAEPNNLLSFLDAISRKTRSLLLATATPVQLHPIEAFDLVHALGIPTCKVMGNTYSKWRKNPQVMLDMVSGRENYPQSWIKLWDIMRNPFPTKTRSDFDRVNRIRDRLDIADETFVLPTDYFESLDPVNQDRIRSLCDTDDFIANYNPYIRHIVRRTREFLENTLNVETGEPYLKRIAVDLYGEGDDGAIALDGYFRQAYEIAQEFCESLSSRVQAGGFMTTTLLRRIGSTMLAGENTAKRLLSWTAEGRTVLREEFDFDYEEDEIEEQTTDIRDLSSSEVLLLKDLVQLLEHNRSSDPKYLKVLDILRNGTEFGDTPWMKSGCIVFSQYLDSANYIAKNLSVDLPDLQVGLYAGGNNSGCYTNGEFRKETKDDIKEMVRTYQIKVLVGTDSASEGLNLQALSTLINLDLPWNPTRLEQRKGRIQRIGQVAPRIKIFNMRYKNSVEDKVHAVLSDRLKNIKDIFGQIPDTLEDIWVHIALNDIEKAKERINQVPPSNPFAIKYETGIMETEDWEACTFVLDQGDKMKKLLESW